MRLVVNWKTLISFIMGKQKTRFQNCKVLEMGNGTRRPSWNSKMNNQIKNAQQEKRLGVIYIPKQLFLSEKYIHDFE